MQHAVASSGVGAAAAAAAAPLVAAALCIEIQAACSRLRESDRLLQAVRAALSTGRLDRRVAGAARVG